MTQNYEINNFRTFPFIISYRIPKYYIIINS